MKRASTTAPAPRRSKNSWARSRYSVLKIRASGLNSAGAEALADPVADLRAERPRRGTRRSHDAEVQVRVAAAGLGRGEEPGDEQQRVAGQREPGGCPTRRRRRAAARSSRRSRSGPSGLEPVRGGEHRRGHDRRRHCAVAGPARLTASVPGWHDGKRGTGYGDPADRPTAERTRPNPSRAPEHHVAKPLVIVESPAKGKTIAGYLGERLHGDGERRAHPRPARRQEGAAGADPEKVETHGRLAGIDPDDHFDVVVRRARHEEEGRRRAEAGAEGRRRAHPRDRRGPRGRGHRLARARGAAAEGAGEADGVPRDHAARDPRGARAARASST